MLKIRLFFFGLFLALLFSVHAQKKSFNTELLAHVPFTERSAGCWGFEKDGIKYAIIGNFSTTLIFSLEDPKNPRLRYSASGTNSIWREIKSFKDHIYVVTDQGQDGLTIIDMSKAPETISHSFYKPVLTVGNDTHEMRTCHYNFIDEKGFLYLSGCNFSQRGVLIFDLKPDPKNPVFVGAADQAYSHDTYVRGDTMYNSEILAGRLAFYDVRDRTQPKLMVTQVTSRAFTHNAWPSDNTKYVFTTDERSGAFLESYDISDYNNIKLLDQFRPLERENDGVIPHNTHYLNGFLVTSWNTDGIRITDAHRPDNLVEVGYFDTWEDPAICHNGFNGCWGVFPFTGSNIIYGSDINNGLFIIQVDYKRACYLEGAITDGNGNGISNARIEILSSQLNKAFSGANGIFKTGLASSGTYQVRITHPDFEAVEKIVALEHGEVMELTFQMVRKNSVSLKMNTIDVDGKPLSAKVLVRGIANVYNLETDVNGVLSTEILAGDYDIFVSAWGHKVQVSEKANLNENATLAFVLDPGYEDNFENDLRWNVVNSSPVISGSWVRAKPNQTEYLNDLIANPGVDGEDSGSFAMVTGNGSRGADCDDVEEGRTVLYSPEMNLSKYAEPQLNYDIWFFNASAGAPLTDTLYVKLSDGMTEVIVDKFYGATQEWIKVRNKSIPTEFLSAPGIKLVIEARKRVAGTIVEAGFDHFFVSEKVVSSVQDNSYLKDMTIFPNPAETSVEVRLENISGEFNKSEYQIFDQSGRPVLSGRVEFNTFAIDISFLHAGLYTIVVPGHKVQRFTRI